MSLPSSQNPPRNAVIKTQFGMWSALEKFVLSIMERFHFPEIGKVVQVFASEMEVIVEFPYRPALIMKSTSQSGNIVTKRLKVFSIFASNDDGICAPPNVGDWGICFFRAGDTNSGFFFGFHWGKINKVPKIHGTDMQPKWVVIKRNGSHFLLDEYGDLELWHAKKNQIYISEGYETFNTPTNQSSEIQLWCNQHTKPTEFKLMTWIRQKDGKQNDTQVDGETQHVQLHRRRITLWDMNEKACPYDPKFVTDSSAEISELMFNTYTSDGSYDVFDEVVSKTITTKDSQRRWYTGNIKKHTIKYKVGVGSSLLRPVIQPREDYEDAYEFNWDKFNQSLWLKESHIDKSQTFVKESTWFKDKMVYTSYAANEAEAVTETKQMYGEMAVKEYKEAISKFMYEIDEMYQMAITDDTVEKQAALATAPGSLDFPLPYSSSDSPLYPTDPTNPNPYVPGVGWTYAPGNSPLPITAPITSPIFYNPDPIISPVTPSPINGEES